MAVDIFLKLDGIPGESKDDKHKDEIDVLSWSWGVSNSGSHDIGGGGGSGKANFQDFHFSAKASKATPKLMEHCATGKHIASGKLVARKAGDKPQEYLKITFTDMIVSSYQTGGSHEDPIEQYSLNFAKVEMEYAEQATDGSLKGAIKAGYDLKTNKKV